MSRSRSFVFTINNYDDDDVARVRALCDDAQYAVVGKEVGDSGTPHLQGYAYFACQRSFASIKKKLPRAHIEVARGSADENADYCKKGGDVLIEVGTRKQQGKRTDIDDVREDLRAGKRMFDIVDTARSYQSCKMAEKWLEYREPPRTEAPEVRWYWGEAGVGKTLAAREWLEKDGDDAFVPVSFKWWQGYDGHRSVLLDDVRKDFCKYHEMLKLLDRYPYRVEMKGGARQLRATKIAITAPEPPQDMWCTREDLWQLLRRISLVIHVEPSGITETVPSKEMLVRSDL